MEDARLSYLCIYNPNLDPSGGQIENQIVFAYTPDTVEPDLNLRRIGLAQGVVEFAKGFADGETVNTLETSQSRLVIEKIEDSNWWVVACAKFATIPKDGAVEYTNKELSTADILIAELKRAYRRFRLHYGTFSQILENGSRETLVDSLKKWWFAWCEYWSVDMNNEGAIGIFDGVRFSKGELAEGTVEVVEKSLEKFGPDGVLDMVLTRYEPTGSIESQGCVWPGLKLSTESVDDISRWVKDCERCNNDSAFLEETGFVYHYKPSENVTPVTGMTRTSSATSGKIGNEIHDNNSHNNDNNNDSNEENDHRTSNTNDDEDKPISTGLSATMNATYSATVDSMTHFMGMMRMKSMSNLFLKQHTGQQESVHEAEDIAESKFMIGLNSVLERDEIEEDDDDDDDEEEERCSLNNTPNEINDCESDSGDGFKDDNTITSKLVFLRLKDEQDFKQFNLVIYRRRPFTFTLVYNPKSTVLTARDHYIALHLRLASLVEPLNTDIMAPYFEPHQPHQPQPKFYYVVHDPTSKSVRSSLPEIPPLPTAKQLDNPDSSSDAEALLMKRLDMIHVHNAVAQLAIDWRQPVYLGGREHERFVRTFGNWWIYWCRLPDQRQAIFARKWSKNSGNGKTGLLSVLGKDAKQWLDNYKHYDKV